MTGMSPRGGPVFLYRSTDMSTEPQTVAEAPVALRPAVAVYNVPRPGMKGEADHIVVYGHSSLFYWWPVWLVCFILAAATYAEGDQSGGVTVSNTNGPGAIFVVTLLVVTLSSTVVFRGLVSVIAA